MVKKFLLNISEEKGKAQTNTAFVWNPANDKFLFKTDLKVSSLKMIHIS